MNDRTIRTLYKKEVQIK